MPAAPRPPANNSESVVPMPPLHIQRRLTHSMDGISVWHHPACRATVQHHHADDRPPPETPPDPHPAARGKHHVAHWGDQPGVIKRSTALDVNESRRPKNSRRGNERACRLGAFLQYKVEGRGTSCPRIMTVSSPRQPRRALSQGPAKGKTRGHSCTMPGYGTVLEPSPQYPAPGRFGCCLLDVPPVTGETHTHSLPRGSTVHVPRPITTNSGDPDPTPAATATGPIHLTLRLVFPKGGGRRSRRDTHRDSTNDSDSDSCSRPKKSRKRSSKGELTQALRAMTSLADSLAGICRAIEQPQQTVTAEASAPQRSAGRHSDQTRIKAELSQGDAEPQARSRYCVSIDTRQGEQQVLLHEPGHQPQHPPPYPPTPVAEPLRFYRNPHNPEVPCAVPALQHGHRDVNRQPPPQQAATHMEHTAAELAYHSEPLCVPQMQHEPHVQYGAVVDRHGQHRLPEDRPGTWARFSEQNAAALEIMRTDPPMQRRTDTEPAVGYLDMWLS